MELIEDGIPLPPRPISHRSLSWDNRRVRTKTRAVADLLPLGFFVVAGALIAFAARGRSRPISSCWASPVSRMRALWSGWRSVDTFHR